MFFFINSRETCVADGQTIFVFGYFRILDTEPELATCIACNRGS